MTPRERTLRAIRRQAPDHVPAYYSVLPGAQRRYGEQLPALWQHTLPHGTPQEVAAHVQGVLAALAGSGGVIGWGEVASDVPFANVEAMVRAFAGQA